MSGKIIPTILGKGQRFPGIGSPPTFWPFVVSLGTVMALVGMSFSMLLYYNEYIRRRKVHWKSNCLLSWSQQVLTSLCLSSMAVILLTVVPCPLPVPHALKRSYDFSPLICVCRVLTLIDFIMFHQSYNPGINPVLSQDILSFLYVAGFSLLICFRTFSIGVHVHD